jgi:hypothetical protein
MDYYITTDVNMASTKRRYELWMGQTWQKKHPTLIPDCTLSQNNSLNVFCSVDEAYVFFSTWSGNNSLVPFIQAYKGVLLPLNDRDRRSFLREGGIPVRGLSSLIQRGGFKQKQSLPAGSLVSDDYCHASHCAAQHMCDTEYLKNLRSCHKSRLMTICRLNTTAVQAF